MVKGKIAPSLACADYWKMEEQVEALEKGGSDFLHVDIMDGHFVKNFALNSDFVKRLKQKTDIPVEVHLQVSAPERFVKMFGEAGADIFTFHFEACDRLHQIEKQIKEYDMKVGVALNPCTPINVLDTALHKLDMITVMTVDPGFAGQSFVQGGLKKVSSLKKICQEKGLNLDIAVDGNISKKNIILTGEKGANVFILGTSSIFREGDLESLTSRFKSIAEKAIK